MFLDGNASDSILLTCAQFYKLNYLLIEYQFSSDKNYFFWFCFAAGNTTRRDYGPLGYPFKKLGGGVLNTFVVAVIKSECLSKPSDADIKKAIREGLNTIRLHHSNVQSRNDILRTIDEGAESDSVV